MGDVGVDFGRDRGARNVGVFPGRDTRCAESGCSPGESIYYVLDDYCINSD